MSKVLVVDDEPDIAESLAVTLHAQGYDVATASSGPAGLEAAERENPDIILLDVMMPGLNGFEVCRRLKQNEKTKKIPILMITALNQTEDRVAGLDAGADDFIGKPFVDIELKARLRAHLRTKFLRDELEQSFLKLRELEQMRDTLTHMLVHDLKAPLTAIKGGVAVWMDYAETHQEIPPSYKQILSNAGSSSQRMLDMIQDILDVSRLEENKLPVQKTEAQITTLIRDCIKMLEPVARDRGIRLTSENSGEIPSFFVDTSLVQRVLVNLISNSLKFTEKGGSILVKAEWRKSENQVECSVEDSGIGIPKAVLPRLFDKFFQGTNVEVSRKGQGLGLAFCRLAMESQGGTIWAESDPGKGSRFVMRFPLS